MEAASVEIPKRARSPARRPRKSWTRFLLPTYVVVVLLYTMIPIAVMVLYGFNQAPADRLTFAWNGFTLDWYKRLFEISDLTTALPHVRANSLRALGATRKARSALFPEVPSLHEAGVTDFEMDSWAGLFAPAGTPADIVTLLNAEVRKIIDDPEIKARIGAIGFEAFGSTPDEFGEFAKVQLGKWGKMIRDAGIEPE